MPRVRVIKPIGTYCVGQEISNLQGILADLWCRAGFVERIDGPANPVREERAVRPRPESALLRRSQRRGRGSR